MDKKIKYHITFFNVKEVLLDFLGQREIRKGYDCAGIIK